jgi:hypothetical protein
MLSALNLDDHERLTVLWCCYKERAEVDAARRHKLNVAGFRMHGIGLVVVTGRDGLADV